MFTSWGAADRTRAARRRIWILAAAAGSAITLLITWRLDPLGLDHVSAAAPAQPEARRILPVMSEAQVRWILAESDGVAKAAAHDEKSREHARHG